MALNDNANTNTSTFERVFGKKDAGTNKSTVSNIRGAAGDRPKAQVWVNVGYTKDVVIDGETTQQFIALPQGIPLDTMERLPANSRNADFAARQAAQNHLIDQIMKKAATLEPGEDAIVNLSIQIRRVNEETVAPADETNQFIADLDL